MVAKSKSKSTSDQTPGDIEMPANFEKAIAVAGFGKFNIYLLLVASTVGLASIVDSSAISFILPIAECDLKLDLLDKGILNAATLSGMLISAVGWGYLSDKKGRKKIMVFGNLANVPITICGAISQNVVQLMISKFVGGLIMCGPVAVLMSYINEFHGTAQRARVMMMFGAMFSIACILLPLSALLILPQDWNFHVLGMNFHSWQVFLAICSTPCLVSGTLLLLFPESPRFLMSQGRNREALEIFQKIYAINKGKPAEKYPIKYLVNENPHHKSSDPPDNVSIATIEAAIISEKFEKSNENILNNNNMKEIQKLPSGIKPLFAKPYFGLCLIVCFLNFFIMLGYNTVRMWSPQLFASLDEYEQISNAGTSMCTIIEYSINKTESAQNSTEECVVAITYASYSNNIIVSVTSFVAYLVAGSLVNTLGNKFIEVFSGVTAGLCGIALYWSSSTLPTLVITSLYTSIGGIATTSVVGTSVNLFPTSLRTIIIALSMVIARLGAIVGNVLFPILMTSGCLPPFLMVGVVMFFAAALSAVLPNTKKMDLK